VRRLVYRLICVAIVAAVGLAAGGTGHAPRAESIRAAGVLAQSNSKAGSAILNTGDLGPGDSASGTVTITNTGNLAGAFVLDKSNLSDVLGPNGGVLSGALELKVEDLSAGNEVYAGPLGAMGPRPLGTFNPGQAHTYRFTVELPERGDVVDNLFTGAQTTVQYNWVAEAAEPLPAPRRPAPPKDGSAKPKPPAAKAAGPRVTVRVPRRQRLLRQRGIYVRVRCDRPCSIDVRVRLKSGSRASTRVWRVRRAIPGQKTVRLKVKVPRRDLSRLRSLLRRSKSIRVLVSARAKDRSGAFSRAIKTAVKGPRD
jgi:hypothetical protein